MNFENKIKNIDELPLFLTVSDIQEITGLGRDNSYALVNSKGFPKVKIKKKIVVPKLAFIEFMNNPNKYVN